MKTGKSLTELAAELDRQQQTKRDFIADTRELTMLNGNELAINGQGEFAVRPIAHGQIADHLEIPTKFYNRLRDQYPRLLDHNVNELFRATPAPRMVRTLDGQARAFLSNRYRRIDNYDLAQAVLPILGEMPDVQFPSMEITESRLYIHAVNPRLQGDVKLGDTVQAGVLIRNSEVGMGQVEVAGFIYRLICLNGSTTGDAVRRLHTGRRIEGEESAYEIYQDETLKADDRAFFLKVVDMTRAALTEARFRQVLTKLQLAAQSIEMQEPSAGVSELGKRFAFTEGEQQSILKYLTTGADLTKWGALNAVTRAAQDVDSYDRSMELQAVGGQILELASTEWKTIASVREPVAVGA